MHIKIVWWAYCCFVAQLMFSWLHSDSACISVFTTLHCHCHVSSIARYLTEEQELSVRCSIRYQMSVLLSISISISSSMSCCKTDLWILINGKCPAGHLQFCVCMGPTLILCHYTCRNEIDSRVSKENTVCLHWRHCSQAQALLLSWC